jgi:hypothetical protein
MKEANSGSSGSLPSDALLRSRRTLILRHALGTGDNGRGRAYRNHFVTGPGSDDYDDCEALVAAGLMRKFNGNPLTGGDPCYVVTDEGKAAAKGPK